MGESIITIFYPTSGARPAEARSILNLTPEQSCEKCESDKEDGSCHTCLYSDESSLTRDEAREFTSPG